MMEKMVKSNGVGFVEIAKIFLMQGAILFSFGPAAPFLHILMPPHCASEQVDDRAASFMKESQLASSVDG